MGSNQERAIKMNKIDGLRFHHGIVPLKLKALIDKYKVDMVLDGLERMEKEHPKPRETTTQQLERIVGAASKKRSANNIQEELRASYSEMLKEREGQYERGVTAEVSQLKEQLDEALEKGGVSQEGYNTGVKFLVGIGLELEEDEESDVPF